MKILNILSLIILIGCATSETRIHNQSNNFIDIEVTKEKFHLECAEIDKKENKSLMTFYAISGDTVHQFIFRSISETNWCENKVKNEYNKLVKKMHTVRLIGISPNKDKNYLVDESVPQSLKVPSRLINWTFIRLETKKGCKAYFNNGCDPENYWGGLFPQG